MRWKLLGLGVCMLGSLALADAPALAQQGSLNSGLNGSIVSGLDGSLNGGIGSGLGLPGGTGSPSGESMFRDRDNAFGGCAPGQSDPDHRGCRPNEWVLRDAASPYTLNLPDPNRMTTYYGDFSYSPGGN